MIRRKEKLKKLITAILLVCVLITSIACGSSVGNSAYDNGDGASIAGYSLAMQDYVVEMQVGDTKELTVKEFKSGDANLDTSLLTFAVENQDIATVSGQTVTALKAGDTKVKVSYKNINVSVTVVVNDSVKKISLSNDYVYVVKGKSVDLPVATVYVNGIETSFTPVYTVKNTGVATIEGEKIKGEREGSTSVNVFYQGVSVDFNLVVLKDDIILKCETETSIVVGESHTLNIQEFTVDGKNTPVSLISYKSNNESVVRIDGQKLVGQSKGVANVKMYYGGKEINSVSVSVYNKAGANDATNLSGSVMTFGRSYRDAENNLVFDNVNGGLDFWFYGTECKLVLDIDEIADMSQKINNYTWITAYLDDEIKEGFITDTIPDDTLLYDRGDMFLECKHMPIDAAAGKNVEFTVYSGLDNGLHHVRILKASEQNMGDWFSFRVKRIVESSACQLVESLTPQKTLKIDVFGDSITCGAGIYGVGESNITSINGDGTKTYAAITARALNADINVFSQSGLSVGAVMNGVPTGCSLKTCWDKYSERNQSVCEIDADTQLVVINLGTNDFGALADTIGDPTNGGRLDANFFNGTNGDRKDGKSGVYTAEEMSVDIKDTLTAMRVKYPNATFIWCYGMMYEQTNIRDIITSALNDLGGETAGYYYLKLPYDIYGGATHPTTLGHILAAKTLINFIIDNNLA